MRIASPAVNHRSVSASFALDLVSVVWRTLLHARIRCIYSCITSCRRHRTECLPQASKVLFLALSVISYCCFFYSFVTQISRERLNGFAPNSQGRRVWSIAGKSLNVKVKSQGHQRQKRAWHSHHPRQRRKGTRSLQVTSRSSGRHHSVPAGGDFGACVRCVW